MKFIQPLLESINISFWITSIVKRLTALIVIFCIIFCFRLKKWIRVSLVIILAGGAGNLLSHFYYPYHIVDFIYIEGFQVINVADLAFYIGLLGLIASALIYILKKVLKKQK